MGQQLVMGRVDTLHSVILNEKRTIWISLPRSYHSSPKTQEGPAVQEPVSHEPASQGPALQKRAVHEPLQRYPVVYLLDGNNHFASVSAMLRQLSPQDGNQVFPDMIVVGILNTERNRDFTPYRSNWWLYPTTQDFGFNGGNDRFAAFLEKELIPYIDSLYPTAPYRLLIGHSLAGLAVTNIMIGHTPMFNAYIAIDPSMWFDGRKFLQQHVQPDLIQKRFPGTKFYLGIANSVQKDLDTTTILKDTTAATFHMRSIFKFRDMVLQNANDSLCFAWKYYDQDTHMSAPLITIYDGLRFIFDYYPIEVDARYYDPKDNRDPAALFRSHFKKVSQQIGYTMLPPENLVNLFANSFDDVQLDKKVLSLRLLNVQNYPKSFDANDAIGDVYAAQSNVKEARRFYEQALLIRENAATRAKLLKLREVQ